MKTQRIIKVLSNFFLSILCFEKQTKNYKEMTLTEFKERIINIISSSNSKKQIKERISELKYLYQVSIYYGTSPRKNSVNSANGIPVTTTLFWHPEGSFAIG